jgi:hypothetical protein
MVKRTNIFEIIPVLETYNYYKIGSEKNTIVCHLHMKQRFNSLRGWRYEDQGLRPTQKKLQDPKKIQVNLILQTV